MQLESPELVCAHQMRFPSSLGNGRQVANLGGVLVEMETGLVVIFTLVLGLNLAPKKEMKNVLISYPAFWSHYPQER